MPEILKSQVKFISRKAPTIGTMLSPSMFISEEGCWNTWLSTIGFYNCGHQKCKAWKHAIKAQQLLPLLSVHKVRSYINYNTKYVINWITCKRCNIQNVGCLTIAFKVRIRRHWSDAMSPSAIIMSMASCHFSQVHNGNVAFFTFMGIEKVFKPIRGGNHRKKMLSHETYWIFTFETKSPHGLNIRQNVILQY